jgi:Mn-dependent DtxR family transcriptional regulator
MKTMTFNHWDVLQLIYSDNTRGFSPHSHRIEKNMLKALLKAEWVIEDEEGRLTVTEKGLNDAKEQVAALYS